MQRRTTGRNLISLVAAGSAIGPFIADWNRTHIFNPNWPPHAKFHGGQTMLMGLLLGLLSLGFLWLPRNARIGHLRLATVFGSLYWITQLGAILFPGSGVTDPEYGYKLPKIAGMRLSQIHLAIGDLLLILAGYTIETKRLERILRALIAPPCRRDTINLVNHSSAHAPRRHDLNGANHCCRLSREYVSLRFVAGVAAFIRQTVGSDNIENTGEREPPMAGTCEICGKTLSFGHNVSFSKKRTNRVFRPNIQKTVVMDKGKSKSVNACTRCIKTMAKPGVSTELSSLRERRAR